jgi:hypothetical protein
MLTVPGKSEILRDLNETPLEYGSLHGKKKGTVGKKNLCRANVYAKYLEIGKQNIRPITTNLMGHQ